MWLNPIYANRKYIGIIIHNAVTSGRISVNEAPIVCNFINPRVPYVLGKILAIHCNHSGIAEFGYDTPLSISSGIDVHSNNMRGVSRR